MIQEPSERAVLLLWRTGRTNYKEKERLFCTLKMVCGILYSRVLKNTRYEDDYTYY